jgi:cobalt-zinc-cadmium efflux system membrane fusion protein
MKSSGIVRWVGSAAFVAVLAGTAYATRGHWLPWVQQQLTSISRTAPASTEPQAPVKDAKILELSAQARQNLNLVAKPVKPQSYWRTVLIPGEIVDRPGLSDRGVTSPAVGVVTQVHAFPGDTVKVGDPLVTLRLFSEYLQNTQSEFFKATRETELVREQIARIQEAVKSGALPEARLIDLNNQLRRQSALIQAYRQDLLTRGLTPPQIEQIAEGDFVTTIEVSAPPVAASTARSANVETANLELVGQRPDGGLAYEVQELKVDLGQQVQAGQLLCTLSNHHALYIAGHAFKQEAPYLEAAAQQGRPIDVEFAEDDTHGWPSLTQRFEIRHLANAVDADSRTFDFFIPLTNQSRGYEQDGQTFVVWRFRPGQRVRLHVPVEEFQNVMVLPAAAVVREGPEAYVFRQNGNLFDRRPVHVLHEDRLHVVLANDGSVTPGMYLAQSSAATLNRVLKAQAARGEQPGLHVHPDGTTHAAH